MYYIGIIVTGFILGIVAPGDITQPIWWAVVLLGNLISSLVWYEITKGG